MARTLLVTLAITVEHLEGEDLALASEGSSEIEDENGETIAYPAGDDTDLDETSPGEIAETIAAMLPESNDEMWAGSGIYAKLADAEVRSAKWVSA